MNNETPSGKIPNVSWLIALIAFAVLVGLVMWGPDSRQVSEAPKPESREVIPVYTGITPAAGMPLAEDQTLDFVPHWTARNGVPFYAWTNPVGKRVDVFVMRDPTTGEPRLFSFPADRVGGSEGPAEPPVVTGSETSDRQPQIGPK